MPEKKAVTSPSVAAEPDRKHGWNSAFRIAISYIEI